MNTVNNKNILLGLPIEYKKLPEYFDAHNISDDTDTKNSVIEKFKNEFTLQIYTAKELQNMLIENGFEIIGQYGMDGSEFLEEKTINILTVAKKTHY